MGKLLEELKRRNVIRVAVTYAVASWLLLQIADLVLDNIQAPAWIMQVFMLALALGFPLVLLFSWAFELTPEGLKREKDVEAERPVTLQTARKLDHITIALLVLVLGVIGIGRLFPSAPTSAAAAVGGIPDKSIAVLAFKDLSPKGDQAYFAEGISEELLNVLAQIPDLKVAGRTSSFAFKGQHRDLREIGDILHVAHVLEGSLRKDGNRVRITAQLVETDTGFHEFSKTYDKTLDDVFAVQDDIAREIGGALRSAIFGTDLAIAPSRPTAPEAYSNFLRARQWIHSRDAELMARAVELLDRSIEIDPDYAPAYAQKATAILLLSDAGSAYGEIPEADALRLSRPLIDRALDLDPTLAEAHAVLGFWYSFSAKTREEAIPNLRRALEINPVLADANTWLGVVLEQDGAVDKSRALYEGVIERDPLFAPAFSNLIQSYLYTNELDRAETLLRRIERIDGAPSWVLLARGLIAMANGEIASAIEALRAAYELNPNLSVLRAVYANACLAVGDYETAAAVDYQTFRPFSLTLAGRQDEAEAVFESLGDREFDNTDLGGIADWYLLLDRPADLVHFMEGRFGSEDFVDALPPSKGETTLYTDLVFSLRQLGRDAEADRLMALTAEVLDDLASQGVDDSFFWMNRAEYAALSGDPEAMLAHLRRAIDRGFVFMPGFYRRALDRYRGDSRFIEMENEVVRRAKEERRKLGMISP